jgi:hypothetical protein
MHVRASRTSDRPHVTRPTAETTPLERLAHGLLIPTWQLQRRRIAMLAVTTLLISSDGLAPIITGWALGVAFIVTLALLNRRRIRTDDPRV